MPDLAPGALVRDRSGGLWRVLSLTDHGPERGAYTEEHRPERHPAEPARVCWAPVAALEVADTPHCQCGADLDDRTAPGCGACDPRTADVEAGRVEP